MNGTLSKAEIGERIADLRKLKGLTQEDLARSVKISRTSLTQIELGKRSVDILELKELSVKRFHAKSRNCDQRRKEIEEAKRTNFHSNISSR